MVFLSLVRDPHFTLIKDHFLDDTLLLTSDYIFLVPKHEDHCIEPLMMTIMDYGYYQIDKQDSEFKVLHLGKAFKMATVNTVVVVTYTL